jgi:octaprenyl-diphosphate synthase
MAVMTTHPANRTTAHSSETAPKRASLARLQSLAAEDLMRVNQVMIEALNGDVPLISELSSHIIAAGGKRLRPSLVIASAHVLGYQGARHIALAACVEFIHTATLLHDDVVDESHLRRGEATANALFGNKASVLVGDFILSRAFQMMVGDGSLDVLAVLSDAAAIISRGEVKQLMVSNNPQACEEDYFEVIGAKTAALFAAACEIGPLVAGKPEYRTHMRNYGYHLGVAFQLIDDALDYVAAQETLGKTVGDDFRDGKITLPIILAYQAGDETERNFWHRTLEDQHMEDGDFAKALAIIERHKTIDATLERARHYGRTALNDIETLPECEAKAALIDTIEFCITREF